MLEQILEHVATACHDPATSSQPSPRRPTDRPRNPHAPPQLMLRHPRRVNPNRIPTTRRQVHLQDRPPPHSLAPNHRMRRVLIRIRCIRIDFRRITPVPEERQRHLQIPRLPVRNRPLYQSSPCFRAIEIHSIRRPLSKCVSSHVVGTWRINSKSSSRYLIALRSKSGHVIRSRPQRERGPACAAPWAPGCTGAIPAAPIVGLITGKGACRNHLRRLIVPRAIPKASPM
jgi:hypothetical protein